MSLSGEFTRRFQDTLGKPLEQSVPLRDHSHFKIGGPADFFFTAADCGELCDAVGIARASRFPFYIIGGGYNILFDDNGFRGLIIRNQAAGIRRSEEMEIAVDSGTTLEELVEYCRAEGLGGLEFLVGIPGTVGGAVFGNAGAFDRDIGQILNRAQLLSPSGEVIQAGKDTLEFDYRWSSLKRSGDILLSADFEIFPRDRQHIAAETEENLDRRKDRHPPWGVACAGSYFKNPVTPSGEKVPAAFLLDRVGAKDLRVGDAHVYQGHANFIINAGEAGSRDVRRLAELMKAEVRKRFQIELEEEVIYLPAEIPDL